MGIDWWFLGGCVVFLTFGPACYYGIYWLIAMYWG